MEVKGEGDNSIIIVIDFDTCVSTYKLKKTKKDININNID